MARKLCVRPSDWFFVLAVFLTIGWVASPASAQPYTIDWYTIDGGGGSMSGGGYTLSGTVGQPDAGGPMAGAGFTLSGGYWAAGDAPPVCVPDFTHDGILDFFDVVTFLGLFAATDPSADINEDGIWDFFDVITFLGLFAAGCP